MFNFLTEQDQYKSANIRLFKRDTGSYWLSEEKRIAQQYANIRTRDNITGYVHDSSYKYFKLVASPFLNQISVLCKIKNTNTLSMPTIGARILVYGKYQTDKDSFRVSSQKQQVARKVFVVTDYKKAPPLLPKPPLTLEGISEQLFIGDWEHLPFEVQKLVASEFVSSPPFGKITGGLWVGLGHATKQAQAYRFFPSFLKRLLPKEFVSPSKTDLKKLWSDPLIKKMPYNFKTKRFVTKNTQISRSSFFREPCGLGTTKNEYYDNNWDSFEQNVDSAVLLPDDFRVPRLNQQNLDPVPEVLQTLVAHLFRVFPVEETVNEKLDTSEFNKKAFNLLKSYDYDPIQVKSLNPHRFMDQSKILRISGMIARNDVHTKVLKSDVKKALNFQLDTYHEYVKSFHEQVRTIRKQDKKNIKIELRHINHPLLRKMVRIINDHNPENRYVNFTRLIEWFKAEELKPRSPFLTFHDALERMTLHNILVEKMDLKTGERMYKINEVTLSYF